jgi:hypothetical protein
MERLSPALHASVRRMLRQARELDDAAKAEKRSAISPSASNATHPASRRASSRD